MEELMTIIQDRKKNPRDGSYTCSLFEGGVKKIGEKILEEAKEVVMAATDEEGKKRIIFEIADLVYHVLVLMGYEEITVEEINKELKRRMK
jgi:phosphoribosyl-ATP pyrophosphohydrolase